VPICSASKVMFEMTCVEYFRLSHMDWIVTSSSMLGWDSG
jgi:roadblock/LC7 domain-containing protein